jgi:putative transposase
MKASGPGEPHCGMSRLRRHSLPGQPHHVIQRGNNRAVIFRTNEDFLYFHESLRLATHRFDCLIHAYVFMSNHVHLLMTPADSTALGHAMRSLGIRYAGYFNRRYGRTGTLFESRYRSHVVTSERYLFTCYRYIEENPLRAGLVRSLPAYRWSSYHANALGAEDALLSPHERFTSLGRTRRERQLAYRALFRDEISPDVLTSIRLATRRGTMLTDAGTLAPLHSLL